MRRLTYPSSTSLLNLLLVMTLGSTLASTTGCGALFTQAKENLKERAAEQADIQAVKLGVELRDRYGIDIAKDDPRGQLMKIIRKEIKDGNGELASILADTEKVQTLGDAVRVLTTYHGVVTDKAKQAQIGQEALQASSNALKGVGSAALLAALAAGGAWIRGQGKDQALRFLVDKIEKASAKGLPASEVKELAKAPVAGEEKAAGVLRSVVKEMFPNPTPKAPAPTVTVTTSNLGAANQERCG